MNQLRLCAGLLLLSTVVAAEEDSEIANRAHALGDNVFNVDFPNATSLSPEPFRNGRDTVDPSGGTPPRETSIGVVAPKLKKTYDGLSFVDNARLTEGFIFIPPDPSGAAGHSRLMSVTNVMIECRNKGGKLIWDSSLKNFFAPLIPETFTFDPKIIYDHFSRRFIVVDLDAVRDPPTFSSRILLAVSKDKNPDSGSAEYWDFYEIDSLILIDGRYFWADYPGFEYDEEAIYITNNMFAVSDGGPSRYGGPRLWVVDKKELYDKQTLVQHIFSDVFGIGTTHMPSKVYDQEGIPQPTGGPPGVGTFLIGYSGLTDGFDEYLTVTTLFNMLGDTPDHVAQFVNIGDVEVVSGSCGKWPPLPDAKQAGGPRAIEVNDRRVLDAVWRDDSLWITTTIRIGECEEEGVTKGYYVQLNTTDLVLSVVSQGIIGGENIDPMDTAGAEVTTFFPAVDVNDSGEAMFTFSASSPNIYGSSFISGPDGTNVQCIREGQGYYVRTFGGDRNRWGDYLGISVDPSNNDFFWSFSQYAQEPLEPGFLNETGSWGTAWARTSGSQGSTDGGGSKNMRPSRETGTQGSTSGGGRKHAVHPWDY